jgi:hypothetical protein
MGACIAEPCGLGTTFERSRAHARAVESKLLTTEMARKTHSDLEAMLDAEGRNWARLMFEELLERRAQVEERRKVTGADGAQRTRVRASERMLSSIVGEVAVPRLAYQAPGHEDLHPLDAALNLPRERYSHGMRRLVAMYAAKESFEGVIESIAIATGKRIGKRQVEELAIRGAGDFDAFYEARGGSEQA